MSAQTPHAVDLRNVCKTYRGSVKALRGVDLQIKEGEIFGLLGPNGAGKSTLVKIIMTVVRASSATGTVLGAPVGTKGMLGRVGYLPEHHRMPRYLTGRQILDFYGALAGVSRRDRNERAPRLLEMVGMSKWAGRKIGGYSKGMLQRVGLAQALINDPALVVLDEPTDGVDPVGRREIREALVKLRDQGRTVLVNSHLLSEVELVTDRVAILVQGQVRMQGTIHELTADSQRYEVECSGESPPWSSTEGLTTRPRPGGGTVLVRHGADAGPMQSVVDKLRQESRTIYALRPVRENLEDLFIRAVQDPATGQALPPGAAEGGR